MDIKVGTWPPEQDNLLGEEVDLFYWLCLLNRCQHWSIEKVSMSRPHILEVREIRPGWNHFFVLHEIERYEI